MTEHFLVPDPRHAGFSDPFLYALARRNEAMARVVNADGTVEINGTPCPFVAASPSLPPGTRVMVFGRFSGQGAGYYCVSEVDYLADQQRRVRERVEHEQRIQAARLAGLQAIAERKRRAHEEGQAVLRRLRLPVAWHVGYKSVVRALTPNSRLDGLTHNAVFHVVVDADLDAGRLQRRSGQFLCTQSQSKWGGGYTPERESPYEFDGETFEPVVSCPQCLALLDRKGWLLPTE